MIKRHISLKPTNAEKAARLFKGKYGYKKGLKTQAVADHLYSGNGNSPSKLQSARATVGQAKPYWEKVGYVLGSVDGMEGPRYCLVATKEEAEMIQGQQWRRTMGNLKSSLRQEALLIQSGLLKESTPKILNRFLELTEGMVTKEIPNPELLSDKSNITKV